MKSKQQYRADAYAAELYVEKEGAEEARHSAIMGDIVRRKAYGLPMGTEVVLEHAVGYYWQAQGNRALVKIYTSK